MNRSDPRGVPSTGCAAADCALSASEFAFAASARSESVGTRPNSLRNTVKGFWSRLSENDADTDVRYGENSAVSLSVLPRKSEYWLEKSNPGRRSDRSE